VIIFVNSVSANDTSKCKGRSPAVKPSSSALGEYLFGIVLNQLSICARLSKFLFDDVPLDYMAESVATEFKFAGGKLPPNISKRFHLAAAFTNCIFSDGQGPSAGCSVRCLSAE